MCYPEFLGFPAVLLGFYSLYCNQTKPFFIKLLLVGVLIIVVETQPGQGQTECPEVCVSGVHVRGEQIIESVLPAWNHSPPKLQFPVSPNPRERMVFLNAFSGRGGKEPFC